MLSKMTKAGYLIIRITTGLISAVFLMYSFFTLWDMYRTEIKAFASYDLLQYRPDIENDEPPYLDELLEINPDTAAWLTIYGTNIDYPVMQGKNDNEYLNKTATGEYTISGSIFMAARNSKDFSDPYTLIYGHHMENGSMFGDIEKFADKDFFYNTGNRRFKTDEGVLIMENVVYNLRIMAYMDTDAYNREIYYSDKSQEEFYEFLSYIKENALYYRDMEADKLIALSTCHDATSYGRMVLICQAELRTDPLPTREEEPLTPHRKAVGHPMAGAYWSLMNLAILLLTVYTALPVHLLMAGQCSKIAKKMKTLKMLRIKAEPHMSMLKLRKPALRKPGLKKIRRTASVRETKLKMICVMLALISILIFILTEDLHKPIQMTDAFTPLMLILWAGTYAARRSVVMLCDKRSGRSVGS